MGAIRTTLDLHRLNADFELLEKRSQPSRSWVQHFFDLFYIFIHYSVNTLNNIQDINGVNRTLSPSSTNSQTCNLLMASQGGGCGTYFPSPGGGYLHDNDQQTQYTADEWGIVVGSNNVAVTPQDNDLGTKIAHGIAAGELLYAGTEIIYPTFANPNGAMVLRRYFTNESGGNVTVNEVGMISTGFDTSANDTSYLFLIARDVLGAPVVIANTQLLVVTYTAQITV